MRSRTANERVRQRLRVLERELVVLIAENSHEPPNRVFHLSVNLFPISDYTDD